MPPALLLDRGKSFDAHRRFQTVPWTDHLAEALAIRKCQAIIPVVPMGLMSGPAARQSGMDGVLISDPEPLVWSYPVPLEGLLAFDDRVRPRDRCPRGKQSFVLQTAKQSLTVTLLTFAVALAVRLSTHQKLDRTSQSMVLAHCGCLVSLCDMDGLSVRACADK